MSIKKIILLLILLAAVIFLIPYSIPIILALVTAILLEPVVKSGIKLLRLKRRWIVIIVFVLFLTLFGLGVYWIITTLVVQILKLMENFPEYYRVTSENIQTLVIHFENYYTKIPKEYLSTIQQGINSLETTTIGLASSITKSIFDFFTSIPLLLIHTIIYLVAVFLFSLDLPGVKRNVINMFSESAKEKVELVINQLSRALTGFIKAQIIFSFVTFTLSLIGLLILDVRYVVILSLLVVIVDILPIIGAGSFLVPWAIYSFLTGNNTLAIGLVILFGVITVVRRVIEPKILGSSLGISALSTLISLYIGFELAGFIGLLAGPILVILFTTLKSAGFIKYKIDF
jgi:sporulation integral membrane protein YtvI